MDNVNITKKKILIAGGTGFLGSSIIRKLKEKNYNYITTSLRQGVDLRNLEQTIKYFQSQKPHVLIHAAAYIGGIKFGLDHAGEIYYNNILINTNLIEAARLAGVKKIIIPIANCAYPDVVNKDFKEDEFWNGPLNETVMVYGMVKKAQWAQSWAYTRQYNMQFVNLILPNMYGPNDYFDEKRSHALGALLMKIVKAKIKNLPQVSVWGTGKPVREWLYVNDGAEALIRAIDINHFVDPINIGVGKGISIAKLANLIKDIIGYNGKLVFDTTKPDGAPYKVMNIDKCKRIFKWYPKTNLKEGIKETYKWYIQNINEI